MTTNRQAAGTPRRSPPPEARIVHEGRGGHIEIEGCRYAIEAMQDGHFCIHFPNGQRHPRRALHLAALTQLAEAQEPSWRVENKCRR